MTKMVSNCKWVHMSTVTTAFSILGSAQASPTGAYLQAVKKVLRYLHGTIDMRLTLGRGTDHSLQLTCFADADWASRVRAISSPSDAGPSTTNLNSRLVWPNPRVKPSITLRLTPPRRDSTSANLWGRSPTPPSPTHRNHQHLGGQPKRHRVLPECLVNEKTKHNGMKWHLTRTTWSREPSSWGTSPLTKWWLICSPNKYHDMHWQDTEVQSWEEQTECNASSRSYLQGECCK
jgi:hypothetical protein